MKYIFFDLDGTLVDSSKGIKNAFRYAFEKLNLKSPEDPILNTFIGPPLETSFSSILVDDKKVDKAISEFRYYYREKGVFEVKLYSQITDMLNMMRDKGYQLYITTSKNETMTYKMLEYLNIKTYFNSIFGALPDSYHKADVLKRAIKESKAKLNEAIIIGDTSFDMIGGKQVGIATLGVVWGFGKNEDLLKNGADKLAIKPLEILKILQGL